MITLTESAIERIKELFKDESDQNLKLRIFVEGGGCSGFRYRFAFDNETNEDDFDLDFNGVKILIDSMSSQYLQGANIDFVSDMMGSNFKIENPNNESGRCGCGESFST